MPMLHHNTRNRPQLRGPARDEEERRIYPQRRQGPESLVPIDWAEYDYHRGGHARGLEDTEADTHIFARGPADWYVTGRLHASRARGFPDPRSDSTLSSGGMSGAAPVMEIIPNPSHVEAQVYMPPQQTAMEALRHRFMSDHCGVHMRACCGTDSPCIPGQWCDWGKGMRQRGHILEAWNPIFSGE